jgi:hypothetical protein
MADFSLHHSQEDKFQSSGSLNGVPRVGEVVSAKFSEDGQWYNYHIILEHF